MQTPDDKLDLDSISFDDMIGEGLSSLPDIEDVEEFEEEPQEEFEEEFEENEAEYSDETEDETFEEEEEEDDYEEGDEDEEPLEGNSVAAEIAKTLGFEMDNEYADTVEGLTEFAKDVAQDVAEEQLESLFQQYPEVQKHLDYVMSGGDSDKFFEAHNPTTDYNNFNLTEKDLGSQRAILNQYFQLKGHDNEFIQEMLDDYEDSGKLYGKANAAKGALAQAQGEYRENMLADQREQQEQLAQENSQFWEGVADIIESGNEFAGIQIPARQKGKFFDYISEPSGPNGETQRDLDYSEAELEVKLAIDYLMYSGFKLDDIINTKAKTKSAQNLRTRIQSNQERTKSARKASRRTKDFDPDNLDMNALF
tara:strand:- start:489 stop:1586 length:1098 start_codon:yes stop_codon:yes gene_type:complete